MSIKMNKNSMLTHECINGDNNENNINNENHDIKNNNENK